MRVVLLGSLVLNLLMIGVAARPHKNPPVEPGHTFEANVKPPADIEKMMRQACYDCHSSETLWPWYSHVPVLGAFMEDDVNNARASLNFSEWSTQAGRTPMEAAGMLLAAGAGVENGLMPKKPYPYMHAAARLTPAQIERFSEWSRATAKAIATSAQENSVRPAPAPNSDGSTSIDPNKKYVARYRHTKPAPR